MPGGRTLEAEGTAVMMALRLEHRRTSKEPARPEQSEGARAGGGEAVDGSGKRMGPSAS